MATSDPRTTQIYGSTLTLGTFANRYDRAILHCIDRTLTTTNPDAMADSITGMVAELGNYHPQWPSLPMQTMTSTRFGPTKALLTAAYWRSSVGSLPHPPGQPKAHMQQGYWSTDWVRESSTYWNTNLISGYPNGEIPGMYSSLAWENPDPSRKPHKRDFVMPVIKLYIPTVLNFNPFATVSVAKNKVNKFSLTYDGITILPGKIRFDGLSVEPEQNSSVYNIVYEFTLNQGGFWYEDVWFGGGIQTGPLADGNYPSRPAVEVPEEQWRTRVLPSHQWIDFPNFPSG